MCMNDIAPFSNLDTLSIINQLPGYFVLKDLNSIYCSANVNAANLLGFASPQDLIGETDYDLNCSAALYADGFIGEDKLTIKHNKLKFLSHFSYVNNEWRTCIYEKSIFRNQAGMIIGIGCYVIDVTNCNVIDLTRFLLKTDQHYHYEIYKQQFSYILSDSYLDNGLSSREAECLFFIYVEKLAKLLAKFLIYQQKPSNIILNR